MCLSVHPSPVHPALKFMINLANQVKHLWWRGVKPRQTRRKKTIWERNNMNHYVFVYVFPIVYLNFSLNSLNLKKTMRGGATQTIYKVFWGHPIVSTSTWICTLGPGVACRPSARMCRRCPTAGWRASTGGTARSAPPSATSDTSSTRSSGTFNN